MIKNAISGKAIASAEMYSHHAENPKDYLTDFMQSASAQIVWLSSQPIYLTPDMGELELDIVIQQSGLLQSHSNFLFAKHFELVNAQTKNPVFISDNDAGSRSETKKLMSVSKRYWVGKVRVPTAGDYVFLAALRKDSLASSNITVKVEAMANVWNPDPLMVVSISACLFCGVIVNILARR